MALSMSINYLKPFADWLSISYPASCSPHLEIISLLNDSNPMGYAEMGAGKELYKTEFGGSCFVTSKESYTNLSISGSMLSSSRDAGTFRELESLLGSAPHNITRLDVAYDTPMPGEQAISNIQRMYPTGYAKLAGRSRQMNYNLSQLDKGRQTGTVYFQTKSYKGTILLRAYDKAWEQLQAHGVTIPPTTRYEVTVNRGASLKDFSRPDAVFWHFLPEGLLKRPAGLPDWSATERIDYDSHNGTRTTDYERLRFLIENSPALLQLVERAASVNGGSLLLEREIRAMLSQYAEGMERSGNPAIVEYPDGSSIALDV